MHVHTLCGVVHVVHVIPVIPPLACVNSVPDLYQIYPMVISATSCKQDCQVTEQSGTGECNQLQVVGKLSRGALTVGASDDTILYTGVTPRVRGFY